MLLIIKTADHSNDINRYHPFLVPPVLCSRYSFSPSVPASPSARPLMSHAVPKKKSASASRINVEYSNRFSLVSSHYNKLSLKPFRTAAQKSLPPAPQFLPQVKPVSEQFPEDLICLFSIQKDQITIFGFRKQDRQGAHSGLSTGM